MHYVHPLEGQRVFARSDGSVLAYVVAAEALLASYRTGCHAVRFTLETTNASHLHPLTKARQRPRAAALQLKYPASGSSTHKAGTLNLA